MKQEEPTPQKSHDMAYSKLGCLGGWKGLVLITFTGGKDAVVVLSELVQEKNVFRIFSNACS